MTASKSHARPYIDQLLERLCNAEVAGCTCNIKTHDPQFHKIDCHYSIFVFSQMAIVDAMRLLQRIQLDMSRRPQGMTPAKQQLYDDIVAFTKDVSI